MNHPKGYVCLRTPSPPRLDGSLDCPLWDRAPWTDTFVDISTDEVPRFQTRAKMLWDDEYYERMRGGRVGVSVGDGDGKLEVVLAFMPAEA